MTTDDAVRLVAHRLEDGSLDPATLMGMLSPAAIDRLRRVPVAILDPPGQCPKCLVERSGPAMWVEGNRARCCCVPCHQKARRVLIAGYQVCEDCPYRAHAEAEAVS